MMVELQRVLPYRSGCSFPAAEVRKEVDMSISEVNECILFFKWPGELTTTIAITMANELVFDDNLDRELTCHPNAEITRCACFASLLRSFGKPGL